MQKSPRTRRPFSAIEFIGQVPLEDLAHGHLLAVSLSRKQRVRQVLRAVYRGPSSAVQVGRLGH